MRRLSERIRLDPTLGPMPQPRPLSLPRRESTRDVLLEMNRQLELMLTTSAKRDRTMMRMTGTLVVLTVLLAAPVIWVVLDRLLH
jgi:hypothetical protein